MSDLRLRILKNWATDPQNGVNAILDLMVDVYGDDERPANLNVYEETTTAAVFRGTFPKPRANGPIQYPCLAFLLQNAPFTSGNDELLTPDTVISEGTLNVRAVLITQDVESEKAATDIAYWMRAIRGSLILLNRAPDASRELAGKGLRLLPATSMMQVAVPTDLGDLVCAGAIDLSYPAWETTPAIPYL